MAYRFNVFTGELDYYEPAASTSATGVPLVVADGATYTAPADVQSLNAVALRVDGILRVDGVLVML